MGLCPRMRHHRAHHDRRRYLRWSFFLSDLYRREGHQSRSYPLGSPIAWSRPSATPHNAHRVWLREATAHAGYQLWSALESHPRHAGYSLRWYQCAVAHPPRYTPLSLGSWSQDGGTTSPHLLYVHARAYKLRCVPSPTSAAYSSPSRRWHNRTSFPGRLRLARPRSLCLVRPHHGRCQHSAHAMRSRCRSSLLQTYTQTWYNQSLQWSCAQCLGYPHTSRWTLRLPRWLVLWSPWSRMPRVS